MKLIPDWRTKNLRCHFCGKTQSVKYSMKILNPVVSDKPTDVCVCNLCALRYSDKQIEDECHV